MNEIWVGISRLRLAQRNQSVATLARAARLREQIRQWQEARGIEFEDVVQTLHQLREERLSELSGRY